MGFIRKLVSTTTAAMIALIVVSVAPASAEETTALCKSNEGGALTCSHPKTTQVHAVAKAPLLHSSIVDVLCNESLVQAQVLEPAKPQVAHLTTLTWTGCHRHNSAACTVTTVLLGLLEVLKTAPNLAEVTSSGTAVRVQCGAFIDCTFEGKPKLHGLGADLPTHAGILHANTAVERSTQSHPKALCPSTSTWLALYEALEDVYVKAPAVVEEKDETTALCKSNEGGALTCSHPKTTQAHAIAKTPLLHSSIVDVLCNESLAQAKVSEPAKPQVAHLTTLTWTGCHRHNSAACTVTTVLLGLLEVLKTAPNLAEVTSSGTAVRVQCGAFIDCTFEGKPKLHGLGADLPTHAGLLIVSTTVEKSTQNHPKSLCPSTSTWLATYEPLEDVYVKAPAAATEEKDETTALCKSNEGGTLTCKAEALTEEAHAIAKTPLLHSSIVDVLCNESLSKAQVLDLGKPQLVHLTELTWTGCHRHNGAACTVTTILLGLLEVLKTAPNLAEVTSSGTAVRVQCGAFIDCTFEGKPKLHGLGGALPVHAGLLIVSTTVEKSTQNHPKSLCPSTSTWLALYETLEDVYVKS